MNEQRPDAQSRQCPHCGKTIDAAANLCPHCVQWLDATPEQQQAPPTDTCQANATCADVTVDAGPELEASADTQSEASAPPYYIQTPLVQISADYSEAPGIPISPAAYSTPDPLPSAETQDANVHNASGVPMVVPHAPEYAYTQQPTFHNVPFWPRVAAMLIDGLIIAVPIGIVLIAVTGMTGLSWDVETTEWQLLQNVVGGFATLFRVLYYTLMEGTWGATLGKMALGMRVVRADGTRITYGIAVKEIIGNCTCSLGYLSVAFHPEYRGWHDQLLGTRVIYTR